MSENKLSYESAIERLEEIVEKLNSNDITLDESLNLFEEGTMLTKKCNNMIENARQKIVEIEKDA